MTPLGRAVAGLAVAGTLLMTAPARALDPSSPEPTGAAGAPYRPLGLNLTPAPGIPQPPAPAAYRPLGLDLAGAPLAPQPGPPGGPPQDYAAAANAAQWREMAQRIGGPPVVPSEPAADPRAVQLATIEPMPAPPVTNEEGPALAIALAPLPQEALDIDLERLPLSDQHEVKPVLDAGPDLRARLGQAGLTRLREAGFPIEGTYTPLYGTFRIAVTPVYLDAGRASTGAAGGFGLAPLAGTLAPGLPLALRSQNAVGAALLAGYSYGPLKADLGSSPLGFPVQRLLGGIVIAPKLFNETTQLRFEARRQSVTDSLLSYAGTRDPVTGVTWGGVTQTGANVAIAYDNGHFGAYGRGGGDWLDGQHVRENGELDVAVGAFFRPYDRRGIVVKLGADLSYMSYDKNLRFFTVGQGGYFSPQNYVNLSLPVELSGRNGRLGYAAGAAVGVRAFNEKTSPYFPTSTVNEALLQGAGNPGIYAGRHVLGPSFNVGGQVEWALDHGFAAGAKALADNERDYTEGVLKLYLRKTFDPHSPGPIFPERRPAQW